MPRLLLAALLLSLAACKDAPPPVHAAPAKPKPPQAQAPSITVDPNHELAMRVRRALEEGGKIETAGIDITATDGLVTLFGTAGTKDERERAARLAEKVDGVKSVQNKLVVVRGS